MATKTKTSEPTASEVVQVEKSFTEALELLNAGKLDAAATAFTRVQAEAMSQERLNLARSARGYMVAIEARRHAQDAPGAEGAEMSAQLLLNQKNPQEALDTLDKGIKAMPERAVLHYLKAVAHAQLGQIQESADALGKSVEFDADMLFQFRLEPDFDSIRHSAPFAALLRG